MIDEILKHNEDFVNNGSYLHYSAGKYPRKTGSSLLHGHPSGRTASGCLGIKDGDVKMIKNAGAVITDPFDTTVRSLIIAVLELGVEEIMVITHTNCGVASITPGTIRSHLAARGIAKETINRMEAEGLDFNLWFQGFETPQEEAERTVSLLRTHPLLPRDVKINGFVIDVVTGRLEPVN